MEILGEMADRYYGKLMIIELTVNPVIQIFLEFMT